MGDEQHTRQLYLHTHSILSVVHVPASAHITLLHSICTPHVLLFDCTCCWVSQATRALLAAKEAGDGAGWRAFQAAVRPLKLQRGRLEREGQELGDALAAAAQVRRAARVRMYSMCVGRVAGRGSRQHAGATGTARPSCEDLCSEMGGRGGPLD